MLHLALAMLPVAPLTLAAPAPQDPLERDAVLAWVKQNALPIATPEAGHGFEDLEPLAEVIGDARIVSLGEATHGTREIFQLKHRMLEFLVERMGFRAFGIEASYPDCVRINDYVEHGLGDPQEALHGQGFWTWDTQEVLALIEWMRAYNAAPGREQPVRFYGIDMQSPAPAVSGALAYVEAHAPDLAQALRADLEPLTRARIFLEFAGLAEGVKQGIDLGLETLLDYLEVEAEILIEDSSREEWARAQQHARVAEQAKRLIAGTVGSYGNSWRDKCMADNTTWVLEQEPAGTRILLWAHNGHVKRDGPPRGYPMMGYYLEEAYGDDHVVFGFGFHHGGFQAMLAPRGAEDTGPSLRPFVVGPPPPEAAGSILGAEGTPQNYALDLRRAPATGPVADWLARSVPMRSIGATYSEASAERWFRPTILGEQFDVLLFLRETTAARPNPLTRKSHGLDEPR